MLDPLLCPARLRSSLRSQQRISYRSGLSGTTWPCVTNSLCQTQPARTSHLQFFKMTLSSDGLLIHLEHNSSISRKLSKMSSSSLHSDFSCVCFSHKNQVGLSVNKYYFCLGKIHHVDLVCRRDKQTCRCHLSSGEKQEK